MSEDAQVQASPGYAVGQMAKAFVTALTHEDGDTRRRAEERLHRWERVAAGMADGTLSIGSRTPVEGLPAWVTPEVARGGFATGAAVAGGPLLPHEVEAARRAGVPAQRHAVFLHHLTDEGLAELNALLDGGRYEITVPEEAALPVVAWLLRAGDRAGALDLLETIGPFADRLRFLPRPAETPPADASLACRETVGEVSQRLAARLPNTAIQAMNEALAVWNPFADELLAHWLETVRDGRVGAVQPDGWRPRGAELLARYRRLAAEHTRCTKHRRPKENLAILRTALEDVLADREPNRLLQHAVDSMVAKRGVPGSPAHTELRATQAVQAARPTHHALAQLVLARLSALPRQEGLPTTEPFTGPVTADEERRTGVPAGTVLPDWLRRTVEGALQAPISTLVERGIVPSAEVLAALVPQLVASTTAMSYQDEALRNLMTAAYRAFRNRRSLLLLNLERQVRFEELPWVRAVSGHRRTGGAARDDARAALVRLGELTLQGFPGTITPNPLIRELATLARQAQIGVPLVEELAADIFMGNFSIKFLQAAQLAADVLEGTIYERYYGIDYAAVRTLGDAPAEQAYGVYALDGFDALCRERAAVPPDRRAWVAADGMVIEQAQILTTHNLAALVHPIGVNPSPGWPDLARRAFGTVCRLVARVHNNPRPLGTIKDAAYAWRQALFFMALCGLKEQISLTAWLQDELDRQPAHVTARLDPVAAGLRHVLVGGGLDDGTAPTARRFLGWQVGGHWMQKIVPAA
ncbi:hypothetical protein SAMN04489712_111260 [Thermomonospora echinospora]|uniref:Uncharacterized protein n=1 Tax=Thermomonospora echinospora TaxID=1992 RepID=A0A1H6CXF4_9ACTN|nr:hypothetical protein [Thermomonospora echinospora]SEG77185.1 hypothetical protein SAMN04489712_111260 [Thermomonospora echinospora]